LLDFFCKERRVYRVFNLLREWRLANAPAAGRCLLNDVARKGELEKAAQLVDRVRLSK
jgi:hypothetical protein